MNVRHSRSRSPLLRCWHWRPRIGAAGADPPDAGRCGHARRSRPAIGWPKRARVKRAPRRRCAVRHAGRQADRRASAAATPAPITSTEFGFPQPNGTLRVIYPDIPDNYCHAAVVSVADLHRRPHRRARARGRGRSQRRRRGYRATARADLRLEIVRAYWALVDGERSRARARGVARRAPTRS